LARERRSVSDQSRSSGYVPLSAKIPIRASGVLDTTLNESAPTAAIARAVLGPEMQNVRVPSVYSTDMNCVGSDPRSNCSSVLPADVPFTITSKCHRLPSRLAHGACSNSKAWAMNRLMPCSRWDTT